jgi:hypothetical protein
MKNLFVNFNLSINKNKLGILLRFHTRPINVVVYDGSIAIVNYLLNVVICINKKFFSA